jgi:hypothetical protein
MTKKFRSEEHLENNVPLFETYITKVITEKDPRYHSPQVQEAIKKEIVRNCRQGNMGGSHTL